MGKWKILIVVWVGFISMTAAIPFGAKAAYHNNILNLMIGYGLASGAMITSAAMFLVPNAINHHPIYGGLGIAMGIIAGYCIHLYDYQLSRIQFMGDAVVTELTSHALLAGLVLGTVYATMPELGLLPGLAIISHKIPAGYAAARRLASKGNAVFILLIPSCAVALTAIPVSFMHLPRNPVVNGIIFGIATGIFLHVAVDFLPSIPSKTEHKQAKNTIPLRILALSSTLLGGLAVFLIWLIFH